MIQPLPEASMRDRLAAVLREQIERGQLRPGDQLPTERVLMQTYDLGRGTVRDAVAMLRAEGLVRTQAPHGSFVRDPNDRTPVALQRGSSFIVRMPSPKERQELDIEDEGVAIVDMQLGAKRFQYPGDRHRFTIS